MKPRRIAITDIHGHYETFRKLLEEQVSLTQEDELYLLGDLINGPRTMKLLNYVMDLQEKDYKVTCLMGNHEHTMLKDIANGRRKKPDPKYFNFLNNMKLFVELDNHVLVHAGFNTALDFPPDDITAMLWEYSWNHTGRNKWLGNRQVIHGHKVLWYNRIIESIEEKSLKIGIDNGVEFHEDENKGRMIALDFENWNYWVQTNVDIKS